MILQFHSVLTETSFGEMILQLDRDLIKSVKPAEVRNKGEFTFYQGEVEGEGAFSELYHYIIVIESQNNEKNEIVFTNHYDRELAMSYIYNEMVAQSQTNSFYKKLKNKMQTDF